MNKNLLKLLIDCTDKNGNLDISRVKASYHGDLASGLRELSHEGYITLLDSDDAIGEIEIEQKSYRLFK